MTYSFEQVNEVLQRPDVAEFLEERKEVCSECGQLIEPVKDGHFLILLNSALEDPEAKRGSSMREKNRFNEHVNNPPGCHSHCGIRGRISNKKHPEQKRLSEFLTFIVSGKIIRREGGRWTFDPTPNNRK
jgi:hypothetical protein